MPKLNETIYLLAAVRTPIGKFGGGLSSLTAVQLGIASAKATLERSSVDPAAVDEVIFGNARQAGVGPNPARQIAIKSAFTPVESAAVSSVRLPMPISISASGYRRRTSAYRSSDRVKAKPIGSRIGSIR